MSHGCSKCAVFFRLNLWPLAAVFDLLCPSSTVARKGSLHSKNYCHGHQSSCSESESPLKILYPEHNQVYHWTFSESESEDPRGPVYYPDIRINVTSSPGANPDLDAALAAVRSSPSLWHFCYRLRTGRGTDALLDVPSVGHHRCSPLHGIPQPALYPLDGLGIDGASNLPLAITPCRLSIWLEPTPAALGDVAVDVTVGVDANTLTPRIESGVVKDLVKHATAIPGRSLDWVVWSATAPLPAATEIPIESSDQQKHCAIEASPEFKSLASFGSALMIAHNDEFGGTFPLSGPRVIGQPSFSAPQPFAKGDKAFESTVGKASDAFTGQLRNDGAVSDAPYLLLVGCGYSGTGAMSALLTQHVKLLVRHEFGNTFETTPNAPGFTGSFADSYLQGSVQTNPPHFSRISISWEKSSDIIAAACKFLFKQWLFEAAGNAALALYAAGDYSAGGITGSADGVWTLRQGSTIQPSPYGEVSYVTRFGASSNHSAASTTVGTEKGVGATAWAGMVAWPMTIRIVSLPPNTRAEVFLMVRHPLKVARSAQATMWPMWYETPSHFWSLGGEKRRFHVKEWIPQSFVAVWDRLPVEFQALLWWSSFNLLGEAQLPVGRKPFRMEEVFEVGDIEPVKAMYEAARSGETVKERDLIGADASAATETKMEEGKVAVDSMGTTSKAEIAIETEGREEGPEKKETKTRDATAPLLTPATVTTSTVDWEAVKAAAVAAPRYNSHVKASKWNSPPVTWEILHAYQQREAAQGSCTEAVAMEAVLSIAQQLCVRYGYAFASCEPNPDTAD